MGKDGIEMAYNYGKLKGRIVEKCGTQKTFAELIGLSERSISLKLNNERPFTQVDIAKCCEILEIPTNEIQSYFFNVNAQSN